MPLYKYLPPPDLNGYALIPLNGYALIPLDGYALIPLNSYDLIPPVDYPNAIIDPTGSSYTLRDK